MANLYSAAVLSLLFCFGAAAGREESVTACSVFSTGDLGAAMGVRVADGEPRLRTPSVTSCLYTGADGSRIAVLLRRDPNPEWVAEQIERMERGVRLGSYHEFSGAGRRAFVLDLRGRGAALCIFGDNYYAQISVLRDGDTSQALELLASRLHWPDFRSSRALAISASAPALSPAARRATPRF